MIPGLGASILSIYSPSFSLWRKSKDTDVSNHADCSKVVEYQTGNRSCHVVRKPKIILCTRVNDIYSVVTGIEVRTKWVTGVQNLIPVFQRNWFWDFLRIGFWKILQLLEMMNEITGIFTMFWSIMCKKQNFDTVMDFEDDKYTYPDHIPISLNSWVPPPVEFGGFFLHLLHNSLTEMKYYFSSFKMHPRRKQFI